jgi:hypothetical protein
MSATALKSLLDLINFAIRNKMPGDPFMDNRDSIFHLLCYTFLSHHCSVSPVETETVAHHYTVSPVETETVENVAYRYHADVIGPTFQGNSHVRLTFELIPAAQRWQFNATYFKNPGASDIFEVVKDESFIEDATVPRVTLNLVHKANVRHVKYFLKSGQKVTASFYELYLSLPGAHGSPKTIMDRNSQEWLEIHLDGNPNDPRATLFQMGDCIPSQVAYDLDELTVTDVSDTGLVTLATHSGIHFTLSADEAIAALPVLQVQ